MSAAPPLLRVVGVDKRFGARGRRERAQRRDRARRARQPDRQQRCRQDHLRQHDHRLPEARRRQHRARRARHHAAATRARSRGSASRARSRSRSSTRRLTVLDNMLVATACGGERLSFWQPARRAEAVQRADALLRALRLDEHPRAHGRRAAGRRAQAARHRDGADRQPALLLLDEPTSGVSAEEKFPMMDMIMTALGSEPMTVLFVEHDMDIVRRYADRVIAFYSGRIIADDVPAAALAADDVRRYVTGDAACRIARPASDADDRIPARRDRVGAGPARPVARGGRPARWSAWSAATAPARRR